MEEKNGEPFNHLSKNIIYNIKNSVNPNKLFDYNPTYNKIRHDIFNMKKLTSEQMESINQLSDRDKMYVIDLFNNMTDWFQEIVSNL